MRLGLRLSGINKKKLFLVSIIVLFSIILGGVSRMIASECSMNDEKEQIAIEDPCSNGPGPVYHIRDICPRCMYKPVSITGTLEYNGVTNYSGCDSDGQTFSYRVYFFYIEEENGDKFPGIILKSNWHNRDLKENEVLTDDEIKNADELGECTIRGVTGEHKLAKEPVIFIHAVERNK